MARSLFQSHWEIYALVNAARQHNLVLLILAPLRKSASPTRLTIDDLVGARTPARLRRPFWRRRSATRRLICGC